MRKMWALLMLCGCFLSLAAAAGAEPQADDRFFPLAAGREWVYTVTVFDAADKETAKEKLLIKNLPATDLEKKKVTPQVYERKKSTTFYYLQNEEGIAAIGARQGEEKPTMFEHPLFMIVSPLKVGATLKKGNLQLTVESLNETIKVPAGTYTDCLKIKTVDTKNGQEIFAWFAADVGRVQSTIKRAQGGRSVIQLESFKK